MEDVIFERLAAVGRGKSVSPEEVARAANPEDWRHALPLVRGAAQALARAGRLVILRKGKPVDPNDFKGVYRLRLP